MNSRPTSKQIAYIAHLTGKDAYRAMAARYNISHSSAQRRLTMADASKFISELIAAQ